MTSSLRIAIVPFVLLACAAPSASVDQTASDLSGHPGTAASHVAVDDLVMGDDGHVCALLHDATVRCWGGNKTEEVCTPCGSCNEAALGAGVWDSIDKSLPG